MGQSEVVALLALVTPLSPPSADPSLNVLYPIALAQLARDAPNCTGNTADLAITYYIGGMISSGAGRSGVASEKIDDYAISYRVDPTSDYFGRYHELVIACNAGSIVSISSMIGGVERTDTLDNFDLDATGILDDGAEDEFL